MCLLQRVNFTGGRWVLPGDGGIYGTDLIAANDLQENGQRGARCFRLRKR